MKEISTVAPTKPLLRAVAACCNLFYGFSHKFFSHWDHCSCLSFTPVSSRLLLQHQSIITSASGHELFLLQLQKPDGERVTLFPNVFNSLSVFVNKGRPIKHICEEIELIFFETKLIFGLRKLSWLFYVNSQLRSVFLYFHLFFLKAF